VTYHSVGHALSPICLLLCAIGISDPCGMTGRQQSQPARLSIPERLLLRWFYRSSKKIDGLCLTAPDEFTLQKTIEALNLIKAYDPLRYRRLLQDLDRVWVRPSFTNDLAAFNLRLRACILSEEFVENDASSTEAIASSIVHEATHARLHKCGIDYDEPLRSRVEAVCFRRELAFAAKLPDGHVVRDRAERSLAFYANPTYWTDAAIEHRYFTEGAEALRRLGVPEWLVRSLLTLATLVRRLRRRQQSMQTARSKPLL
jgi:hypothetical protein